MRYRDDDPPQADYPPEEKITKVTLSAELHGDTWMIACPQWNCEIPDKSLTRGTAIIFAEIENHNKEYHEANYGVVPRDAHRNLKQEAELKHD